MPGVYEQISGNRRKTIFLFFFFIFFIMFLVYFFGLYTGLGAFAIPFALIVAVGSAYFSYYHSDSLVLSISQAKPVTKQQLPQLYNIVEELSIGIGLNSPIRCYIIDDTAPNAFATGRDPQHAAIVVTTGLLQKLNRAELEGVIGHEMSHIKNFDTRIMMYTVVMVGLTALLSDFLLRITFFGRGNREDKGNLGLILAVAAIALAILSPIIATLIKLAISRNREFLADSSSALLTKNPAALASALQKISADTEPLEAANKATEHLYIINPLKEHASALNNLFETHPPLKDRIARLNAM